MPPGVVTVTSTVPAAPAGDVAVIDVALFTVKLAAAVAPNFTLVAPVKPVPVMATLVPPAVGPPTGEMEVTMGNDAGTVMANGTVYAVGAPALPSSSQSVKESTPAAPLRLVDGTSGEAL